jgi:hypothetical protein
MSMVREISLWWSSWTLGKTIGTGSSCVVKLISKKSDRSESVKATKYCAKVIRISKMEPIEQRSAREEVQLMQALARSPHPNIVLFVERFEPYLLNA